MYLDIYIYRERERERASEQTRGAVVELLPEVQLALTNEGRLLRPGLPGQALLSKLGK